MIVKDHQQQLAGFYEGTVLWDAFPSRLLCSNKFLNGLCCLACLVTLICMQSQHNFTLQTNPGDIRGIAHITYSYLSAQSRASVSFYTNSDVPSGDNS